MGEWATREGEPTPNFNAALSDAAWMTGMERNSDLVVMHCYAPLLCNINPGARQWDPNLIGYNALESYGSPSYYAQVMFANHVGDVMPPSSWKTSPEVFLPYSVTRQTKTGKVFLKLVNRGDKAQSVRIALKGLSEIAKEATVTTLSANGPQETNSITEPTKIIPKTTILKGVGAEFEYSFPAWSITVFEVTGK